MASNITACAAECSTQTPHGVGKDRVTDYSLSLAA